MLKTWLGFCCALLVHVQAAAQAPDAAQAAPAVAIEFDATAAQLPQADIAAAVRTELASVGGDEPKGRLQLAVRDGRLVLGYTPATRAIERVTDMPAHAADLPAIVALLAGNLVRDEAGALIAPPAPAPAHVAPTPTVTPTTPIVAQQPPARPKQAAPAQPPARDWPRLRLSVLGKLLAGGSLIGLAGGTPEFGAGAGVRADLPFGRYLGAALMLSTTAFRISSSASADSPGTGAFTDLNMLLKLGLPLRESPIELALYLGPGLMLGGEVEAHGVRRRDGAGTDAIVFDLDVGYSLSAYASATWWIADNWGAFIEFGFDWRHAVMKLPASCGSVLACPLREDPNYVLDLIGGGIPHSMWAVQSALHLGASYRFP